MTRNQRNVLRIAAIAVLLTLLFPPFVEHRGQGMANNVGFSFILLPPKGTASYAIPLVDVALLLAEWTGILIIAAFAWRLNDEAARSTGQPH